MKAVPLLAVTNAVTLALVLLLYFQQDDNQGRQRSSSRQNQTVDVAALKADLLAQLKQDAAELYRPVGTETADPALVKNDDGAKGTTNATNKSGDGPAAEGGTDAPTLPERQMETFRKNVRKAIELNREEDRVNREVERIDRLVANNRIGALNDKQKRAVASVLIASRDKTPRVWRQFRENPELRELPREERAKLIRVEYQKLRDETQKELEEVVPAADAKTIIEEGMRGGDRGGFRGFGGGTPRRGR